MGARAEQIVLQKDGNPFNLRTDTRTQARNHHYIDGSEDDCE